MRMTGMRLSLAIGAMALAGCATATTTTTPPLREGSRGLLAPVPAGWVQVSVDGGGSGATTLWFDPAAPGTWVQATTGVSAGAWCGADGRP